MRMMMRIKRRVALPAPADSEILSIASFLTCVWEG
jgi:hypothetical protein